MSERRHAQAISDGEISIFGHIFPIVEGGARALVVALALTLAACTPPVNEPGGGPGASGAGGSSGRPPVNPGSPAQPGSPTPSPSPSPSPTLPGTGTPTPLPPPPPGVIVPPPGVTPPSAGDGGVPTPAPTPPPTALPPLPSYPPPPAPNPPAADDVVFDPPGGNFVGSQAVRLRAVAGNATIRFTVDGSLPTAASPVYSGEPITLRDTTVIRAFVGAQGPVGAAVYLRAENDLASFESNLPIVVLHTQSSGVLNPAIGTKVVPGTVSVFQPSPGGRVKLIGPATFTMRAGVRVRGNSSRSFAQKSYAFELRQEASDDDDDRAVAGLPSDSDWNLIAPARADRSLVRTALGFTLSNEIGRYAPRVRLVEVFTVETGRTGAVARASYKGVYTLTEKIKINKNRVRINDIDLAARTEPAITGGYILRTDHEAPSFIAGQTLFQVVEPDYDRVPMDAQMAFNNYLQAYLQAFFDAVRAPSFTHPVSGKRYSEFIDVPAFIDHNMLNALFKNVDGMRFSAYYYKDRGGLLAAGPLWDMDRSSGTPFDDDFGNRAAEPREWARADGTHPLRYGYWGRLFADPAFKTAYLQRWNELTAGIFSVPHIHALIDFFAGQVREAQARHFARYPEFPPTGGAHASEIQLIKDWFVARIPWMSENLPK
jgi:hypothetical protein